jgi:prefoldin subunit 5
MLPRYPAHHHRNLLSEYKGYEDEVQALQDKAKALERISEDIKEVKEALNQRHDGQVT